MKIIELRFLKNDILGVKKLFMYNTEPRKIQEKRNLKQ